MRVITPRFLTEGDELVTPVIAHNYLPGERAIDLTCVTATGLRPPAHPRSRRRRAVGGEARLDWRFTAGAAGRATVTASAATAAIATPSRLVFRCCRSD